MSLPYFALYPADFEADTSHLTLEEDGAYNRILRLMWMTPGCSLPDDDAWIMRRMRCDMATFQRVVMPIIAEFMDRKAGRVSSPRLTAEWKKVDVTSKLRATAGKKGGRPKAIDNKQKGQKPGFVFDKARLSDTRALPEPYPDIEKEEAKASSKKRGSRLSDDWFLPMAWGQWAIAEGYSQEVVRIEAENFRDYWHSKAGAGATKLDWQATWRIWLRKASKGRNNGNGHHNGNAAATGRDRFLDEIAEVARARPTPRLVGG